MRSTQRPSLRSAVLFLLTVLLAAGTATADWTSTGVGDLGMAVAAPEKVTDMGGQTASGAYYRFVVPDDWTPADGLVIWNHGFSLNPIGPLDDAVLENDLGPLASVHLSQGYAIAASSYSLTGWALFQTIDDLEEMVAAFYAEHGVPAFVFVYGASLGGIVTLQAIEQADLGNVVGAMPVCGALSGSRVWDGGVDVRLLYDAICGEVPGAAIPGGAAGLAFPPDPNFDATAMGIAVNICTGVSLDPGLRTPDQQARLDQFVDLAQIPETFLLTDMGLAVFGLADLVYDPAKLAGAQAMDNSDVDYGDEAINDSIARVEADPAARNLLVDNFTPSGKVDDVKIVSLHTDKDGLILVENESDYGDKVPANRWSAGVVVEDVPSHCGFTAAELVSGWENLRGWVAGLPQPTAVDLQGACELIEMNPLIPGPCRIDPTYTIADISDRIRPRATCVEDDENLCFYDRFQVSVLSWTNFGGESGDGTAVPLTPETGAFWFFGPENLELLVKVLDGRQINDKYWVFYGSLSNVEYEIRVVDTVTLKQVDYENPLGNFGSVGDTGAF